MCYPYNCGDKCSTAPCTSLDAIMVRKANPSATKGVKFGAVFDGTHPMAHKSTLSTKVPATTVPAKGFWEVPVHDMAKMEVASESAGKNHAECTTWRKWRWQANLQGRTT